MRGDVFSDPRCLQAPPESAEVITLAEGILTFLLFFAFPHRELHGGHRDDPRDEITKLYRKNMKLELQIRKKDGKT